MTCPLKSMPNGNSSEGVSYMDYLGVETLRSLQHCISGVHDEHLFIIVHQTYELWFLQIIKEIDSIREIFMQKKVKESHMLLIVSRLNRVVQIMKILVEQIMILETMTPMDFMDFRDKLSPASGFQSLQFRIIENKLGVRKENRILYQKQDYSDVFTAPQREECKKSENEPSLFALIEKWLERTPCIGGDGETFWVKFSRAVQCFLDSQQKTVEEMNLSERHDNDLHSLNKQREIFDGLLDEEKYNISRAKGDRRFSYKAIQGALLIYFYRDEVIFNLPYQLLNSCMDIDSLLTKWRYNHVMLVQRQLGNRTGTGGSSGYQYLRSTVSDRYKVFLDLFNLSSYLIPRRLIPNLDMGTRHRLTTVCMEENDNDLSSESNEELSD